MAAASKGPARVEVGVWFQVQATSMLPRSEEGGNEPLLLLVMVTTPEHSAVLDDRR